MYSSWRGNRTKLVMLKAGEGVTGLTGVYIIRKPDRYLVKQTSTAFSLKTGDVILQYAEWGEGAADLWANGHWYKNFGSGVTDDDNRLVLDENSFKLVAHGIKEWWVQVKRVDGQTGWVLVEDNFDGMDSLG